MVENEAHDRYRTRSLPLKFDGVEYQNYLYEAVFALDGLVIPEPGEYELWLHANYANLHEQESQPGRPFPPIRVLCWPPRRPSGWRNWEVTRSAGRTFRG